MVVQYQQTSYNKCTVNMTQYVLSGRNVDIFLNSLGHDHVPLTLISKLTWQVCFQAENVDGFLNSLGQKCEPPRSHLACFGTWVLYHSLRVMIMFLFSGFELELYSTHEYHYIYWSVVLSSTHCEAYLIEQPVEASGFISFIFKAVHKLQEVFQAKLLC